MGPGDLTNILCGIEIPADEHVIVGIEGFEDAGVYRISDDVALVQTLDFFTPIVDDPYWFGQIAAANGMSDIYAMGARPVTALNIVCFSPKRYDITILKEILRGGIDKIREAGASLLGGHSVDDEEIKYGISVTGIVHPDRVLKNEGALPGDLLILTKPLGTGIVNTGIKGKMVERETIDKIVRTMACLNKEAAEAMLSVKVHAATDVTGFGLAGHLKEMIKEYLAVELFGDRIPFFHEAADLARIGFVPAGLYRNRDFYKGHVIASEEGFLYDIIFDPQTSGGLLFAVDPGDLPAFERRAKTDNVDFWAIGRFLDEPKGKILLS